MSAKDCRTTLGVAVGLSLLIAGGCASTETTTSSSAMRELTPSFMMTDREKAERKLKDPVSLNLSYGRFQEQTGQPNEARKSYELALRDDPKSVDAILGLARLDQLADKPKEAEAGYQKALKLKPGDPRILACYGEFCVAQKRWPDAFRYFDAAIAAAPKETIYKHELAVAKTRSGDIRGGLAAFTALVGPEKAHYNVAYLLKQQGDPAAAVAQCRMALAINPQFEPAKSMLDQLQPRQVAGDPRGPDRSSVRAAAYASASSNSSAADPSNGIAGRDASGSNQPVPGMKQASWQTAPGSAPGPAQSTAASASFGQGP